MNVAVRDERSTKGRTATDRALSAIETLLAESGRTALLRREALAVGPSAGAVDRALRRLRSQGRIRRYGVGIYGVGGAKVFQAAPEALERLGYRVLSPEPARNWSARRNGSVLRLDRPCHRQIRGHGVRMNFETRSGRLLPPARPPMTRTEEFPTTAETEAHYESFHWCQSYARAEKDLCVAKALDAVESFNTSHAQLALDGGTCLSAYHRLLRRFSEDIDLRIRPSPAAVESIGRVEALKAAGAAFRAHVAEALPWLAPTGKVGSSRRRRAVVHLPIRIPRAGSGRGARDQIRTCGRPLGLRTQGASPNGRCPGNADRGPGGDRRREMGRACTKDSGRLMAHGARFGASCA